MRKLGWLAALMALVVMFPLSSAWAARIEARIDLSAQRMYVYVNGKRAYTWKVSTARPGYRTPVGTFRPQSLQLMHYSSKYENSPMPHSIFFLGGYAVHGTYATGSLGRPVSHGCVRLSPSHAARLYGLVAANRSNSRIVVVR